MREAKIFPVALAAFVIMALATPPAGAQATSTWVSGLGDDANPCSRVAPCKTFAAAISKTASGGEINCIDSGMFGAVTIAKSITIDCGKTFGWVVNTGSNGILINAAPTDLVRLRNLSVEGGGAGENGITILAADTVHIEDVIVNGQRQAGIRDVRAGPAKLYVTNVFIKNSGASGVAVAPADGVVDGVLQNVVCIGNKVGALVSGGGRLRAHRSVFSLNSDVGVQAGPGGTAMLENSVISHNTIGVRAAAGSSTIIEGSVVSHNAIAIQKEDAPPEAPPRDRSL